MYYYTYLIAVSLITSIAFIYDKNAAISSKRRVPERTLHLLELFGGVFAVVALMYLIRHKNRKSSFYVVTYLILVLWITGWIYVSKY